MASNKKRFVQKKEPPPRRIRAKKIIPTYSHPQIERELERTKAAFERLLKTIKESDYNRRAGYFSWSVREQLIHITSYLGGVIPSAVADAEKGRKKPQLPAWLGNTISFLSSRLSSGSRSREALIKRYGLAHDQALELLKKIKPEELDHPIYTVIGQTTLNKLYRDHTQHFAEHESQIKRLIIKH